MAFLGMRPGEVWGGLGASSRPYHDAGSSSSGLCSPWDALSLLGALYGVSGGLLGPPPSNIGVSTAAEGGGQGEDKVMGSHKRLWFVAIPHSS